MPGWLPRRGLLALQAPADRRNGNASLGAKPQHLIAECFDEGGLFVLAQPGKDSGGTHVGGTSDTPVLANVVQTLPQFVIARSPQPDMARFQSLQRQIRDLKAV